MKNPRCWARALDDCVPQMDGDHLISAAAFGRENRDANLRVRVAIKRGRVAADGDLDTSQAGGYDRALTVNTLTANVLCRKHDNALSPVDAESGKLTKSILEFRRLMERRWIPGLQYADKRFTIDGPLIEHWFMKSLFTMMAQDGLGIGSAASEVNTPTDELVHIVFGTSEPRGHIALAGASAVGHERVQVNEFSFVPFHFVPPSDPAKRYIVGCTAEFRGFKFVLNIDPDRSIPLSRLREQHGWGRMDLLRPLRGVNVENGNLEIRFAWPEHRYPRANDRRES